MRIQHNIAALNSYRQLSGNNSAVSKNLEKLSSGYRINRAGDDAAGLAISEKMRAQIAGLETAQKNAHDGISLVQTAEGALTEVHSMLNRMVELADQSANGTYDNKVDRANLQKEVKSLNDEINRIAEGTNFNGINLLDGSLGVSATVEPGKGGDGNATAGTATKTVLDFSKVVAENGNIQAGATVKLGDKVFEFVKAGGTAKTTGAIAVTIGDNRDKSVEALATEIAKKTGANDYGKNTGEVESATANKGVITITTKAPEANVTTAFDGIAASTTGIGLTLQVGDTSDDFNKLTVSVGSMSAKSLGIADVDISTQDGASSAIDKIRTAINTVSSTRGDLGAIQNRLEHTINNLSVTTENMTAAESRIRDTDMAKEMMAYTKNNILVQASQAMLAQANQVPQGVLQLLQ